MLEITDPFTGVDRLRRLSILKLAREIESLGVLGCFMECGVAHGGVSALLGIQAQNSNYQRHLWLFDSFEGLPEPSRVDGEAAARFADGRAAGRLISIGKIVATEAEVKALLIERMRLDHERVHIVKGWFQDTLPAYPGYPIALLHVDGDWYESVKVALHTLWPYVSLGGYVVVDDYGDWEGARLAVQEFLMLEGQGTTLRRQGVTQAYFRKERR